ncbi:glycosyltransferase family 39 protein [Marisediminicola senii]|uniref:glycosyltransferase family 39 protein n=1 Tax=Marisediminicola senii TaxID=2711233 RepID=UPI0013EAE910|nr:hypothetical protein [Marisediminicola senii]
MRGSRATAPALVGLLGLLVSLIGIGTPSVWYDEAATITGATRSWPQLWEMLQNVDVVHGAFYALMHVVFDVIGYSPVTLRLPSAIAIGGAAALTVVLARQLGGSRWIPVIAGLVFVFLPRTVWMGGEGRSFAISALFAVAITVVTVHAQRRARWRWWVLYTALIVLGSLFYVYLTLIVVAHGAAMLWWWLAAGRPVIAEVLRWAVAAVAAAVALLPLVSLVADQSGQLFWIDPLSAETWPSVFVVQWFTGSVPMAVVGWTLIVAGAAILLRRAAGRSDGHTAAPRLPAAAVLLPAVVLPAAALIVITAVSDPLYSPRYVSMCAPFVAIVMATAIDAIRPRWAASIVVVLLVALSVPTIVAQRAPEAKQQSSWAEVADLIAAQRAGMPVDATVGVIWGWVRYHPTATTKVIDYAYPDAFEGVIDVNVNTPAAETGELWETRTRVDESLDRIADADVVYLITSIKRDKRPGITATLVADGWRVAGEYATTDINIVRYERP